MAATTNPLHGTHSPSSPAVSSQTHTIAGILVTVHGLSEVPSSASQIACLWLLHPRLQTRETMAPIASQIISTWNTSNKPTSTHKGLIAIAFDQRNHGSRQVDALHNQAWREGNPRHAQDMFSCYHGTATDTSHLLDYIESYILTTPTSPRITQHLALGISLGGHAVWHCLLADPRITAGVVGIGCPDYTRLMTHRARLSKRESHAATSPPGAAFLGSADFPPALQSAVAQFDPAGLLLPNYFSPTTPDPPLEKAARDRFSILVRERLAGKQILNLSGKVDKLVPYSAGEPFLNVLKGVLRDDPGLDVKLEDVLFEGVGHAFPKQMADKAAEWICGVLAKDGGNEKERGVVSKI
ncbi:alpha/beta-hydrolase [Dothidotthia symphoricarpi CBS 119687]|uniref:Alpha/beta-hydrolase n=1 Tax=Dothidotthia symphoricarpi CBS 119687 TaxID=1392245 RepID=A0A6A6ARF3_9PLEO|nr:alpha/beta-hydrolase [Dothidotthia symphoricarpi CBS 119687]KAF2133748.1 alpha/beta-hydrolase [Dothidotthia symphoricarpi CBS 119687]